MNPKISIVATFYKNKKYIPQLLKSLLRQTYTNWELICIDDCSPQNDFKLLQKLTFRGGVSNKVKIIRNEINYGANPSRKIGIDNATGDYITFIDGDDWFAPQALEKMAEPAITYNTDLVLMNAYRQYPFGIKTKIDNNVENYNKPIYNPNIMDKFFISFFGINIINVAYWGKLIKTEIIRKSDFNYINYPIGEDLLFNLHIFPLLNSMIFIDYHGYNWRFGGITSSSKNMQQIQKIIYDFESIYKIKRAKAELYNYAKAYTPMLIELKNIIYANISSISRYIPNSTQTLPIKKFISQLLMNTEYSQIDRLINNPQLKNDPFVNAVVQRDTNRIYELCHFRYKQEWKRRFIKKAISLFN